MFCGKMLDVENGLVEDNVMIGIDQDSGKIRSVEFNYPKTELIRIRLTSLNC